MLLLVTVACIAMMVSVGLDVRLADLARVARDWRLVVRALLASYIGVPAVAVGLLLLFHAHPLVSAGFLILAACPGAPFGPPITAVARGNLTASAALMRAQGSDSGTPAFDDKQVLNVPRFHTTVFGDIAIPHLRGFYLMPGWGYTGRKEATRDDTVSAPSYNLFDMGARYTLGGEQGRVTFRLYADNIANKKYWSDTGARLGDTFIWLGAPTTVRLAAHYTF